MKRGFSAGGLCHGGAGLALLTESELAEIQRATLEVLERTGIWVEDDEAFAVFAEAGCRVDAETHIVRIPGRLVEMAVQSTPQTFRLYGRDPNNDVVLGGHNVHFMNFGIGINLTDPVTGEHRPSLKSDVGDAAKMVDYCSEIDVLLEPLVPHGVANPAMHILEMELNNCTKPAISGPGSAEEAEACIDIAAAVVGGRDKLRERPIIGMGACTVSPLELTREGTCAWMAGARAGIPVTITSMTMAGGSGPQTLAGTLVMANAEVLAAAVLIQLVAPGNPIIFSSSTLAMDLRYGAAVLGTPEGALLNSAFAQLAQMHGVPSWVQGL
jgi:trimethylamine---corrinoid protein Co-methyltransferase